MDSDLNQQTKENVQTDSIKHSHKSRVYVNTVKLAVKKHNGGGMRFLADCINLGVEAQFAVDRGDEMLRRDWRVLLVYYHPFCHEHVDGEER